MNNMIQFFDTDSYKVSHAQQYPAGTTRVMSYIEARGGADEVQFFGLQYILKQLKCPTVNEVMFARELCNSHFGRDDVFNYEGWLAIAQMGYLPLRVKAVKEGTVVPTKQVLATVENTDPRFPWIVSWFETQLLRVWYPTNVATTSYRIKQVIGHYLEKNGTPESIGFKLHDFGSRGATTQEAAGIGCLGHMINFRGSDTLAGILYAEEFYNADINSVMFSIPASEHSTITSWGEENEIDAYENMIEQFGGEGKLYACVSDSYNIWKALEMWKQLEQTIIAKGGTLVIRPDSGDPVATPVAVVKRLLQLFGYSWNDKGYKVLPDYIRVIQGDGVDEESISSILSLLDLDNISSDNIAFGMGGALLQKHDRDTFKFAMKTCAVEVNGEQRDVYKNPIGDETKASKRGFLTLTTEFESVRISELGDREEALNTVYVDGEMFNDVTFSEIVQ